MTLKERFGPHSTLSLSWVESKHDSKLSLTVRIGIATGLVIVGDFAGGGPLEAQNVVGETPILQLGSRRSPIPTSLSLQLRHAGCWASYSSVAI
jgi:hypothetical protein